MTGAVRATAAIVALLMIVATAMAGGRPAISASAGDPLATVQAVQTRQALDRATAGASTTKEADPTSTPEEDPPVRWEAIGGGVEFSHYFETSGRGELYLLAEARNTNEYAVATPSLLVTLLDVDGNIVGETRPIALFPIIEPGQATPLQVWVNGVSPGSWASESVQVLGFGAGAATCSTGLDLRDLAESERSTTRLRVEGKVYNGGAEPVEGVLVWVAVYRNDGVYAGMANTGIQSTIPPGKSATFSVFGVPNNLPGLSRVGTAQGFTYRTFVTSTSGGVTRC